MEDLDPPREAPGAADAILRSLEAHGLEWDGDVLWQGQRHSAYADIIGQLLADGRAFHCDCSRAQLAAHGNVYPGTCRDRKLPANNTAVRIRVDADTPIQVEDQCQAPLVQDLDAEVGEFIIRRRDGLYAYQLAVVIDDNHQGITQVLRGQDLYDSTPRQIYLQQQLGLPTPIYTHIPVITNSQGQKLSKQTHAPALVDDEACNNLRLALAFLGQAPVATDIDDVATLLDCATQQWQLSAVPRQPDIPESSLY